MEHTDQIRQLLEGIASLTQAVFAQQQQQQQRAEAPPGLNESNKKEFKKKIQMRDIKVQNFEGGASKWEEWSFQMKNAIAANQKDLYDLMVGVENATEEVDELAYYDKPAEESSAELYYVLSQLCAGEALTVVRSVNNCHGVTAWQRLHHKYEPRTMAREIQLLGMVTNPPKPKDIKHVETAIMGWEDKCKMLDAQFKQ
jgi:hypothetical protein